MDHYLDGKTTQTIRQTVHKSLYDLQSIPLETKLIYMHKLEGYRFVEDLRDFQRGKPTKWINTQNGKMSSGIHLDIKFTRLGTTVFSKYHTMKIVQYRFDTYLSYQKMSPEEWMVVAANDQTLQT